MNDAHGGYALVVSMQSVDASTTLFFGRRLGLPPEAIRVVEYGRREVAPLLAAASAVILVRGLFEFADLVRSARFLRTPIYYFLDDNFMVLREQGGADAVFVQRYSGEQLASALRLFAGVLLATPPLVAYFREHRLHQRLLLYPPVAATESGATSSTRERLHLAFFGGRHLHHHFLHTIMPAVRKLATTQPVTVIAVGIGEVIQASPGLSVIHKNYEPSYAHGINTLSEVGVDVLLHPVRPGMANNVYKNPHALITADALGAVPVVSAAPPYDMLRQEDIAILCEDSEDSWYRALRKTSDARARLEIRTRLRHHVAQEFGGSLNRAVIGDILLEHESPRPEWLALRRALVTSQSLLSFSLRALSRAIRMMSAKTRVAIA